MCKKQKAISNGLKALLRERIIDKCNEYRKKTYCPTYALESIEIMFKEYCNLEKDGISTVETLVREMHNLPREKKIKKKEEYFLGV